MKTPAWKRLYDFICEYANVEKITAENKRIVENCIKNNNIAIEVGINKKYLWTMLKSIFDPTPLQKNILLEIYRRLPENGDGILPISYINSKYNVSISNRFNLSLLQILGVMEYHRGYIKTSRERLRKFYPSIEKWIEEEYVPIQRRKNQARKRVPRGTRIKQAIEIIGKPIEEITEDDINNLSRIDWMMKLKETGDENWFIPLRGVKHIKSSLKKLIKNERINRIYGERRSIAIG